MEFTGLSYLTNSFAVILAPDFANRTFPAALVPTFVGEASLCLGLILGRVSVPGCIVPGADSFVA